VPSKKPKGAEADGAEHLPRHVRAQFPHRRGYPADRVCLGRVFPHAGAGITVSSIANCSGSIVSWRASSDEFFADRLSAVYQCVAVGERHSVNAQILNRDEHGNGRRWGHRSIFRPQASPNIPHVDTPPPLAKVVL